LFRYSGNSACIILVICIKHKFMLILYLFTDKRQILFEYYPSMATDPEAWVRFLALPEKKSSGSGTGSTQPREYNWGATW
jgi:hypothetical protein